MPPRKDERGVQSVEEWFETRRKTDGAEGLWRVHDTLYDLTDFAFRHPGGSFWITTTQGTDITEAFETHMNHELVANILSKYEIRRATTPSPCPHTFKHDGFYCTMRRRAWEVLKSQPSGPAPSTCRIADATLAAFLIAATSSAIFQSYAIAALAGVLLALTMGAAHNFWHQRDNFRMYYFDLGMFSSRYLRISHALSHHLYTNSLLDLEVTEFNPFLLFLPFQSRNMVQRDLSKFYLAPLNSLSMPIACLKKVCAA